jgi:hypothetical protein
MTLSKKAVKELAGLELNAFNYSRIIPDALEGGRVKTAGTAIYDINGSLLFRRFPIKRGRKAIGYADVAANEIMGEPLLATSIGPEWSERAIRREAAAAAKKKRRSLKYDKIRFVAYSYPKIALQFLKGNKEVLMLEWKTWEEVPSAEPRRETEPSYAFERWSLVDEMPEATQRSNTRKFKARLKAWKTPTPTRLKRVDPTLIRRREFAVIRPVLKLTDTREIRYSPRSVDHSPCYELRGQQTGVWCVAASAEMLLNFYRYHYDQVRLADELDLGTCASPNGLPYGQENKVVNALENLTSNALDASMHADPSWSVHRDEIRANRPLISFIPRHSRTVVGYTQSLLHLPGKLPFRGVLVYDPWPPTNCATPNAGGVITRWENFNTQTYRYAFSAVLRHI